MNYCKALLRVLNKLPYVKNNQVFFAFLAVRSDLCATALNFSLKVASYFSSKIFDLRFSGLIAVTQGTQRTAMGAGKSRSIHKRSAKRQIKFRNKIF